MKIGFITPNFPFEKRVAILPQQVRESPNEIVIEYGFGATMDIADTEYADAGAVLMSRGYLCTMRYYLFPKINPTKRL